jgi:triacylglycerol lipase
MSVQGLVESTVPVPPAPTTAVGPELQVEEALGSGNRLWIRGCFPEPSLLAGAQHHWWEKKSKGAAASSGHLTTRVGGQDVSAEVVLSPSGHFDAAFTVELPEPRRGWRLARNSLQFRGQTVDKCTFVVTPPANARRAVVVLLPLQCTLPVHGACSLERSELAASWTQQLRSWQHRPDGPSAFYYLACVPPGEASRQSELALAVSTLGWPSGCMILLPATQATAAHSFAAAVDRLRWLLAGALEVSIINLERSVTGALEPRVQPAEDRANFHWQHHPDQFPLLVSTAPVSLRPSRAGLIPRHPVVFCHGLLAFTTFHLQVPDKHNYFNPLRDFLKERGHRALYPEVAPVGSVAMRAGELRSQIDAWTKEPVNIVAHSMGGLDARYMITHLGMADRVSSLTTIACPHRGTALADWFMTNFQQRVPLVRALEALGATVAGFADCCPSACAKFNETTPDMSGVKYFSYGASVPATRVSPMLRRAWNMLTTIEGPNDGMISVASSHWGEYLGTIHADHFAQTPDMKFLRPGEDFDSLAFFGRLLEDLARRGF